MATKTITWPDGSTATLTYTGQGNGTIVVTSDTNQGFGRRTQNVDVQTTDGQVTRQLTVTQLGRPSKDYEYTGAVQSETLPAGTYKLECWGAQGGSYNTTYYGGKGGYSVGEITLEQDTTVYLYVGGRGTGGTTSGVKAGGFNGGGLGYSTSTTYIECGGGGASDIRIGQDSLYARVIVAGGGGGAGSYSSSYRYSGGAGGGTTGLTPSQYSTSYRAGTGGTQTAKGTSYYGSTANSTTYGTLADFGVGAGAKSGTTSYQITGGGAGWYGGGYSRRGAGGGGSGYVYNANTASNYPSGCLLNSAYYLTDAETKAGNTSIPSTSGSTETGHAGNGYIRITNIIKYTVTIRLKDSHGIGMSNVEITVTSAGSTQTVTTDSNGEATFQAQAGTCTLACDDYLLSVTQFDVYDDMTLDVVATKGDLTNAVVTVANQTYSGSALTPAPTVTLNGTTIPSSGYNVSYSNNINAGTATVTITGKNQYEGTANGTFTINKANPTYTAPTARSLEYTGSSQYLTTTGSTNHGTIQYSENGSSWSTIRVSKTNIGTYTTYWRLIGDSNHNDVASTSITTSIAKASRTISFTTSPAAVIVGGGSVSVAASVSAGSGDGTISFSSGNTSIATVSGSNVTGVSAGTCTIYATVSEGTYYKSATTSYTIKVGSSDCVDMGLPSNTLWRSMNVGATSIFSQDCQYFSWGNTDGHTPTSSSSFGSYSWGTGVDTEPYASSTGASISTNLSLSNDAARVVLGSPWRMPTTEEYEELFDNCKFVDANEQEVTSTIKIVTVNGTPGLYLKSNINGNKLFIPCCGYGDGSNLVNRDVHLLCWHSTITSMERARVMLSYNSGTAARSSAPRYQGIPIRPVQ